MFQNWFTILYWGLILAIGGGSIHIASHKMRKMALEAVSRPWPSLKMEYKTTTTTPLLWLKRMAELIFCTKTACDAQNADLISYRFTV